MLLAPIPRALPKEVTNTIYITTKHGELSIPFVVSIPDLTINGLKNDFTQPGDTTVITGDNFDLYGITIEYIFLLLLMVPVVLLMPCHRHVRRKKQRNNFRTQTVGQGGCVRMHSYGRRHVLPESHHGRWR